MNHLGHLRTSIAVCLAAGMWMPQAALAAESQGPASLLAARATGPTPMMSDLAELCDRIGGRPTGSPACERAISWSAARMKELGLDSVTMEEFTVPSLWLPGTESASCLSPEQFPIRVAAAPYGAPTPGNRALEAPLVDAGSGTAEEFAALGDKAHGAIALVHSDEMKSFADLFAEYLRNSPMVAAATQWKVAGLMLMSSRPRGLLYRHPIALSGQAVPFPVAIISREHAERLARLIRAGEVRVSLDLETRSGPAYQSRNVIGEIRGHEKPGEVVLVGAHLDSWDLGTGAEDNGVNAATIIDIARGIAASGLHPRRTIRFVLFTGEEQGMWGSAGYVQLHAAELNNHVAAVIVDTGSGRINGFYLNGRDELRGPVQELLSPVAALGPFTHTSEGIDGTDNFDFLLSGVPNLVGDQDPAPYLPDYHAESDVFERVNAREAATNEAIVSALVWGLADSKERVGERQGRAEVKKLLASTKLDEQMKSFGQWEDWIAHRRGVDKPGGRP